MKKVRSLFFSLLIAAGAIAVAAEVRAAMQAEIELEDGSKIRGEILSLGGGIYTIKSGSLGTFEIDQSKVKNIRMRSSDAAGSGSAGKANSAAPNSTPFEQQQQQASPPLNPSSVQDQVQALQQHIASDPNTMKMIESLQNDPAVQQILRDGDLMRAVNAGDISTLLSNPKILELLGNPTVQEIIRKNTQ